MTAEWPQHSGWPMLERPDEFGMARNAFETGARGLLLLGESGTGKTVLAERVSASYVAAHQAVELPIIGAARDAGVPWGTMVRHVGELQFGGDQIELERTVRPFSPTDRVLLRVDDAHLLDEMSSQYVSWLVRTGHAVFVATTRAFRFLPKSLQLLAKDARVEQIDVGPFDESQVAELLSLALGGELRDRLARRIWRHSGGNALFVRELVREGLRSGALVRTPGGWEWTGSFTATRQLHDLLRTELESLPDSVRTVIELAALGEPMPRTDLLRLVDPADYDLALESGLVKLENSRPIEVARVRPSHPLIGELVRDIVPTATRRDLYQLANEYRSRPARSDTPTARLRTAAWALECGIDPGFDALVSAAAAAMQLHDIDRCIALAHDALAEIPGGEPITGAQRVRALAVRAFALGYVGNQERSRVDIETAWRLICRPDVAAELRADGGEDAACEIVMMRASMAQFLDDDPSRAQAIVTEGAWVLGWRSPDAAHLYALMLRGWAGQWDDFLPEAGAIIDRYGANMPGDAFQLVAPQVFGLCAHGEIDAALELCGWAVEAARANSEAEPWAVGQLRNAEHHALLCLGDVESAARWRPGDTDDDLPFVKFERNLTAVAWAEIDMAEGRWSEAAADLKRVTDRLDENDQGGMSAYAWITRAFAEAVAGAASARRSLSRARRESPRSARVITAELAVTLLCAAVVLGDDVTDEVDELIASTRERGLAVAELDALHIRYLLAGRRDDLKSTIASRIRQVAEHVDGPRARAIAAHVDALESGDDVRVKRAVGDLAKYGTWVHARMPRPPLTTREHEIAALAASGLTSRAIAERLQLSVRTVDSHLSRVFTKLKVRSRADLGRYV